MTVPHAADNASTTPATKPIALILGATGGVGGTVGRRLGAEGWHVRALHRRALAVAASEPSFEWVTGDAMNGSDVLNASEGAQLIVHAVNPPGYRDWGKLVLPMIDNTISAARACGARILLPGTVYNFGPDAFPILEEDSPQNPLTAKGAIRVELEQRLRLAAQDGVPVLIVRAGDFFGPGAANSWFSQGLVRPGRPVTRVMRPAARGIGHQWAYLPDVAETMVRLLGQASRLPTFAVFHMEGVWDEDGERMIGAIARVTKRKLRQHRFPWWLVGLARPVVPLFRELWEMRYLWREPIRMSNGKLRAFLGFEPQTPLDTAIRETLVSLNCLEQPAGPAFGPRGDRLAKNALPLSSRP
ncbi:NAD-dependent epimerase/dehydratase family protein [Rhizobium sp. SGZ-381]|uniref:NAD-dependent epimerase/dehydratase family protein n=1 Tax=Rhizobium sp. SGZ-381 TaxID=3342800 RepID=UPI00366C08CD